MNRIYAIIGEAASGKDSLAKALAAERPDLFHFLVSYTTRPPRENEINGKDYNFITQREFEDKVKSGEILEFAQFRGWWYGTSKENLVEDKINLGVFNPTGVYSLLMKNYSVRVYKLHALDKERLLRQLQREENPDVDEIIRRYSTDKADFQDLPFVYSYLDNRTMDDFEKNVMIITTDAKFDLGQL